MNEYPYYWQFKKHCWLKWEWCENWLWDIFNTIAQLSKIMKVRFLFRHMFTLPGWRDCNLIFCLNMTQIWCFQLHVETEIQFVSLWFVVLDLICTRFMAIWNEWEGWDRNLCDFLPIRMHRVLPWSFSTLTEESYSWQTVYCPPQQNKVYTLATGVAILFFWYHKFSYFCHRYDALVAADTDDVEKMYQCVHACCFGGQMRYNYSEILVTCNYEC